MIKSREEKIKDGWKQYFKNIEKENELIRLLIGYYCKIRPQLLKLVTKPKDKKDRDARFKYKKDDYFEEFAQGNSDFENEFNMDDNDVQNLRNCDLRFKWNEIKNDIESIQERADSISNIYQKEKYDKIINPFYNLKNKLEELQNETRNLKPTIAKNSFTSLFLENFKGFSKRKDKFKNTIKIAPITLIYGPNSYGKSSILQSLLLLNQTVNEGEDFRVINLLSNGNMVKLGTFNDFLNKNSDNKEINIELSLPFNHYIDSEADIQDTSVLTKLYFSFYFAVKQDQILIPKIDLFVKQIDYSDINEPLEQEKCKLCTFKLKENNIYEIEDFNTELLVNIKGKKELKKISFFKLEDFIEEKPFEQIEEIIKNIVYVSSYRTPAERYYVPENNRRIYVGKNGQYTAEILGYDSVVNKNVNKWLKEIAGYNLSDKGNNNTVNSINLDDNTTEIKNINLIDLGSGIAQVLPIITQAFKSNGDMILIEEPEIHLHPKAQAALGGMFADAIDKTDNTFIIETHSENLLLRLEKLIRNGDLAKEDVSIIYVDKDKNGSYCIPLVLDDEGNVENIDEVPGGFFDEGFKELFL